MRYPNSWGRVVWVALLSAVIVTAMACGSSDEPSPPAAIATASMSPTTTATPITSTSFPPTVTPTRPPAVQPYPTSTSLPATPEPMEVVRLDKADFGDPVSGTVFEELLARLPDNEVSRSYAVLTDYAGVAEELGVEFPQPGADSSAIEEFVGVQDITFRETGFTPRIPSWPQDLRDYLSTINWYPYVAFDTWSIEQSAHAGGGFRFVEGSGTRKSYEIALGQFDPDLTAATLAACECDQPTIRTHDGIEYYSWGTEFIGEIQKRFAPPMYDHIGRGPRVLIREGEGYYSIANEAMEDYIDVLQGTVPALGADEDYLQVTRRLASLGLTSDITFYSTGLSLEEASSRGDNQPLFIETARKRDLLKPFSMAATSTGFDGDQAFVGLVISNPDASTAEINAEILVDRFQNVPVSTRSDTTMGDRLRRMEVGVDGNLVVVRLYAHEGDHTLFSYQLQVNNMLVVYE